MQLAARVGWSAVQHRPLTSRWEAHGTTNFCEKSPGMAIICGALRTTERAGATAGTTKEGEAEKMASICLECVGDDGFDVCVDDNAGGLGVPRKIDRGI